MKRRTRESWKELPGGMNRQNDDEMTLDIMLERRKRKKMAISGYGTKRKRTTIKKEAT